MLSFFRSTTTAIEHEEKTTWLELFFDLVYVAILIELGARLSHDVTLEGVLGYALLFIPIWLSWLEPVLYSRRFPTDDIGQRLLTVAYMFVMAILAVQIHGVTGQTATAFVVVYAITKVILALMYGRAWHHYPEYRSTTSTYALYYALLAVLWTAIAVWAPRNYTLWVVVIALALLEPISLPLIRKWVRLPPMHMPPVKAWYVLDRFGELTIIVLGEFFIKAIVGAAEREQYWLTGWHGLCLLSISVGLWWLYFDHLEHTTAAGGHPRIWVDLHYPFLAAVAAYGVAGTKVLDLAPGEALADEKRLLLCLSLAIALLGGAGLEWAGRERSEPMARRPQIRIRIAGAAFLTILALLGGSISAPLLVTLIALTLVVPVALDVRARLKRPGIDQAAATTE